MKTCSIYRGYRFPPAIIARAVWLYHRFALSLRDVEDLFAERGIEVSYETIRQWCARFGPQFARRIKARLGWRGDRWFLDEMVMSIGRSDGTFGVRSTETGMYWIFWFRSERTRGRPDGSFESC